jgi:hypothetical protein
MSTPKKKPVRKAKPAKKPAARPIPPPPPGWEIVGKDDPRLKKLPCRPMAFDPDFPGSGWSKSGYGVGGCISSDFRGTLRYALPIAQAAPASPPMIRLRLPSEKPTMEENLFAVCRTSDGYTIVLAWPKVLPFDHNVRFWFSLPDGILPREPSHEEKWQQEFSEWWTNTGHTDHNGLIADAAWQGFLAAKKGGAE